MNRRCRKFLSLVLSASVLVSGCAPQQPFYCREDGDLSHYLDVATEIEYPDVEEPTLNEVTNALPPLTLKNTDNYEMWDVPLEEAVRITLCNSQVMRKLGGSAEARNRSGPDGGAEVTLTLPLSTIGINERDQEHEARGQTWRTTGR